MGLFDDLPDEQPSVTAKGKRGLFDDLPDEKPAAKDKSGLFDDLPDEADQLDNAAAPWSRTPAWDRPGGIVRDGNKTTMYRTSPERPISYEDEDTRSTFDRVAEYPQALRASIGAAATQMHAGLTGLVGSIVDPAIRANRAYNAIEAGADPMTVVNELNARGGLQEAGERTSRDAAMVAEEARGGLIDKPQGAGWANPARTAPYLLQSAAQQAIPLGEMFLASAIAGPEAAPVVMAAHSAGSKFGEVRARGGDVETAQRAAGLAAPLGYLVGKAPLVGARNAPTAFRAGLAGGGSGAVAAGLSEGANIIAERAIEGRELPSAGEALTRMAEAGAENLVPAGVLGAGMRAKPQARDPGREDYEAAARRELHMRTPAGRGIETANDMLAAARSQNGSTETAQELPQFPKISSDQPLTIDIPAKVRGTSEPPSVEPNRPTVADPAPERVPRVLVEGRQAPDLGAEAGVPAGGRDRATGDTNLSEPGLPVGGERVAATTPEQAASNYQTKVNSDFRAARAEYETLPDTEGGKVLNVDIARELSPEYRADRTRSADIHEPASAFVKRMYAIRLHELPPDSNVLFTGGGTGAGKSSGLEALKSAGSLANEAGLIYDTNLSNFDSARTKIDQALAAGHKVTTLYVYRDPIEALTAGALPRAMRMGRTVPIEEHLKTHVGAAKVVKELADHYANDPRVEIIAVDNSHGKGNARQMDVAQVPSIDYNAIRGKAYDALKAEHQAGRISDSVYRGTAAKGAEPVRQGLHRQPEPERPPQASRPAPQAGTAEGRVDASGQKVESAGPEPGGTVPASGQRTTGAVGTGGDSSGLGSGTRPVQTGTGSDRGLPETAPDRAGAADVRGRDSSPIPATKDGGLSGIIAKNAEKRTLAKTLAAKGESVSLKNARGWTAIAGPDMSKLGGMRLTRFDESGDPIGHVEGKSLEGLLHDALLDGYEPTRADLNAPPRADVPEAKPDSTPISVGRERSVVPESSAPASARASGGERGNTGAAAKVPDGSNPADRAGNVPERDGNNAIASDLTALHDTSQGSAKEPLGKALISWNAGDLKAARDALAAIGKRQYPFEVRRKASELVERIDAEAAPKVEAKTKPEGFSTSLKNEVTDADRADAGRDPIIRDARKSNPESIDRALKAVEKNPALPREIVERAQKGEAITDDDQAVLLVDRVNLRKARDAAADRASDPKASEEARAVAKREWGEAEAKINESDLAISGAGTTAGRTLQLRTRMLRDDFSLEAMERKERVLHGRPLTESEAATVKAEHAKVAEKQKIADATEKASVDDRMKAESEATVKHIVAKEAKSRVNKTADERMQIRLQKQIESLESDLKKRLSACPL